MAGTVRCTFYRFLIPVGSCLDQFGIRRIPLIGGRRIGAGVSRGQGSTALDTEFIAVVVEMATMRAPLHLVYLLVVGVSPDRPAGSGHHR